MQSRAREKGLGGHTALTNRPTRDAEAQIEHALNQDAFQQQSHFAKLANMILVFVRQNVYAKRSMISGLVELVDELSVLDDPLSNADLHLVFG